MSDPRPGRFTTALLHQASDPFRLLVESVRDYAIFMLDWEGRIASWNTGAERIKGYTSDEVLGQPFAVMFTDADTAAGKPRAILNATLAHGTYEDEGLRSRKGEATYWAIFTLTTLYEYERHVGFAVVIRDISESKQRELELRVSERRLGMALDAGKMGLWEWDLRSDLTYWSPRLFDLLGLGSGEPPGLDLLYRHVHPDDLPGLQRTIADVLDRGTRLECDFRIVRANGEVRWLCAWGLVIRDETTGDPIQMFGASFDITDRKEAERKLAASEERLRWMVDGVKDYAILLLDPNGQVVSWNEGAARVYGYTPDEIIGRHRSLFFTPEDVARGLPQHELDTATATGKFSEEGWRVRKDGTRFWSNGAITALRGPDGELQGFVKLVRDLTERLRVETALQVSEARLRTLITAISQVVWTTDATGERVTTDPPWAEYTGLPEDEVRGLGWVNALHPDDRERVAAEWRHSLETRAFYNTQYRVRRPDGGWRHVVVRAVPMVDANGAVQEWVGVCMDDTERFRAEQELLSSTERFRAMLENSSDVISIHDPNGVMVYQSPSIRPVLGYDQYELPGLPVTDYIHPEDLLDTVARIEEVRAAPGVHPPFLTRFRHKNGEWRWCECVGTNLLKNPFVRGVLFNARDVTDRVQAEAGMRLRDRVIQAVSQGIVISDPTRPDNPIIYASLGFEVTTGYRAEEVLGRNCRFLQGKDTDPVTVQQLQTSIRAGIECAVEILNYRKDGTPFWNALYITPIRDHSGRLTHFVGVQADVTERRRLEQAFQQAQKMEAVGRLAGGVAHDFNNLLTVIGGFSDMLLAEMPPADLNRELVTQIRQAGERAAGLTRQLLAFSRQQIVQPVVLDLNHVVYEAEKMLRRLIGEDIRLTTVLDPHLPQIKADPGQVDQVLMNLVVNARDAMPTGGKLTIDTRCVEVSDTEPNYPDLKPGHYAQLSVSDTGCGMPPDVQAHIFEPFFTTKSAGKGTGLGLATVHGIVKQAGGHVQVSSEVGIGTAFKVLLPATEASTNRTSDSRIISSLRGTETVLVVEDEEAVRKITRISLETQGYTVMEAESGPEAVRLLDDQTGPAHLLVTDVVMPEMGGRQLADAVRSRHPGIKVLFVSGYTDDAVIRHGVIEATDDFLQKPFTPLSLAKRVREVLDRGR